MELNREQIVKALEQCEGKGGLCGACPFYWADNCTKRLCTSALALIRELTMEKEKLIEERDTFREYAYAMQKYVEDVRHKEEAGYEPSAARDAAEMEMWRVVALEKKKLTEENERLEDAYSKEYYRVEHLTERLKTTRADTVRKMQERFNQVFGDAGATGVLLCQVFDQIAKEVLGENK